jgi:hypothetical protein
MTTTPRQAGPGRTSLRRRLALALDPLAWALLLAGVVDGFSDNWVHAVLLMAAAAAVWWDAWWESSGHPTPAPVAFLGARRDLRDRPGLVVALLLAAVAFALVAGSWETYTWPMTFAVLVPATVGLVVGWRGTLYERPVPGPVSRRTAAIWWTVLVAGGLWELAALLLQPDIEVGSPDHPTISFLMDSVLAGHAGRTVTLLLWLLLGWWLLAHAPGGRAARPVGEEPG